MKDEWNGDVIRAKREALRLSQAAVAKKVDLDPEVYRRYEVSEREPRVTIARKIAEVLDLTLAEVAGQVPQGIAASPSANSPSIVGAVLQTRRNELGLTLNRVANTAGIPVELYQEYERGNTELPLTTAAALAEVLDISLVKLAGTEQASADLSGTWYANWQAPGVTDTSPHTVEALRITNKLALDNGWRGELDIFSDEILIGWYRPPTRGIRTRMGVFLWIPAADDYLYGRWTGVSESNSVEDGWCVLARTDKRSQDVMQQLINTNQAHAGPNLRIPKLGGWSSGA
ncbi:MULTISPECIES: helix-turn-helix transcriptional regulator [Mycolicibacterium]|uniref:helix-turn-helix domain-containing protein n=1 Tax=Mycolicibacterium TaxID=1866885 RepID=UPI001CDC32D9|nr:helix-turn-helix transcriptional regulator [Mycolicibacterium fortuitum]UBV21682.1 helix-turn-helix domain-containing protein [Mycolicibacterium fortuitum]